MSTPSIDALAVSWIVLGGMTLTVGFPLIGELIRPPLVCPNEMAWARSGTGRAAPPDPGSGFATQWWDGNQASALIVDTPKIAGTNQPHDPRCLERGTRASREAG